MALIDTAALIAAIDHDADWEDGDSDAELEAIDRHETCAHREACDRAADMHAVEETCDWLSCERCDVWRRGT